MAFFNQPCTDAVIQVSPFNCPLLLEIPINKAQGPQKKYPSVTGKEFTQAAMNRNFAALKAKKAELEVVKGNVEVAVA